MPKQSKVIAEKGWNVDDVLAYLKKVCPQIEPDNDGQFVFVHEPDREQQGSVSGNRTTGGRR